MRWFFILPMLFMTTAVMAQEAATIQQGQANFMAQKNTPPAPMKPGKVNVHPKTLADYRAAPVQQ